MFGEVDLDCQPGCLGYVQEELNGASGRRSGGDSILSEIGQRLRV
jgi:hypothetical protein